MVKEYFITIMVIKEKEKEFFIINNGNKFEGDYKNDLKEGKGIFYYNNGDNMTVNIKMI
jgi:hypothetical protein